MSKGQIDFDGLRKVLQAAKAAPLDSLDMSNWFCGTKGCLIGHFCNANPDDPLKLSKVGAYRIPSIGEEGEVRTYEAVGKRFGLTWDQTHYLFGYCCDGIGGGDLSPSQAIERLESFINSGGRK